MRLCKLTLLLLFATLPLACVTRTIERQVHSQNGIETTLRHQTDDGVPVDRGYQHPVEIPAERLRRILAAITIRRTEDDQLVEKSAIAKELLDPVARGLSQSLAVAEPSEEIALTAVRRYRRFGLFSEKYLTSFVSYVSNDLLTLSLSRVEWDLELGKKSANRRKRLPQPRLGDEVMDFRVVPDSAFEATRKQSVQVRWRDERWNEPAP
jgi:hypothetical protein